MKRNSFLSRMKRHTKKNRARRIKKKLYIAIFISLLFISMGIFLSRERFRVTEFTLAGLTRTEESKVQNTIVHWLDQKTFAIYPNSVIWFLQKKSLASTLKREFSTIKDVVVQRDFPNKLELAFEEYKAWGVLCVSDPGGCYWIDREGVAFEKAEDYSGTIVPKIRDERDEPIILGDVRLSKDLMGLITYFNEVAVNDKNLESIQFTIDREDDTLRVRTRDGWEILLLEETDPEKAYKNLQIVLNEEIKGNIILLEYIDLRFGNKVFYKFIDG